MSFVVQCARLALKSIVSRLARSVLTSLGIVISVASVIAVVSIIQGLSYSVLRNFEGLGANVLTAQSDTPFEDRLQGRINRLTMDDYLLVKRKFQGIGHIIPSFEPFGQFGARVTSGRHSGQTRVVAVTASYKDAIHVFPASGRFITDSDNLQAQKVCVIGERLRENLRLPKKPVGTFLIVGGTSMEIVGVMESRGDILGISQDDYVAIPFAVGKRLMPNANREDLTILIDVADPSRLVELQRRVSTTLRQFHHLATDQEDDFRVQTAEQLTQSVSRITNGITLVLGGVVSISLVVGGIGIMNMMLFAVTERTREIGIAKALGARRQNILLQFLLEAAILSGSGGIAGVALGWLIGWLIGIMAPSLPPPSMPGWSIALSVAFSTIIGLIFGVAPAAKAADLDPIEALRFE